MQGNGIDLPKLDYTLLIRLHMSAVLCELMVWQLWRKEDTELTFKLLLLCQFYVRIVSCSVCRDMTYDIDRDINRIARPGLWFVHLVGTV